MKYKFHLSYKKILKRKAQKDQNSNFRKFLIAAVVQSKLDLLPIELIYIDEFSINDRNFNHYGWWEKGRQGYIDCMMENFSMTFFWAFSRQQFYGIMGNKESNNSASFIYFIKKLFESRAKCSTTTDLKPILVFDNATIHKSKDWTKFYHDNKIIVLTIPPYEPALNPAEKLILAIKTKIKSSREKGK